MKRCPRCGETKPLTAFTTDRRNTNGLRNSCQACSAASQKARYAALPEAEKMAARKAAMERYLAHRDLRIAQRRARHLSHRDEENAQIAEWGRKNLTRKKASIAQWRRDHPEQWRAILLRGAHIYRARKAAVPTEVVDFAVIIQRDGMHCHICGQTIARGELSFDHLIPISFGGPHAEWNLAPAHRRCNSGRGPGRTPAQPRLAL